MAAGLKIVLNSIKDAIVFLSPILSGLLCAIILLLLGFLAAKGLKWLVSLVFTKAKFDKGCKQVKITNLLTNGGIKQGPTELLSVLVYWLVIFVTITALPNALGLVPVKKLLVGVLAYIPSVFCAVYVLIVSVIVAFFISGIVLVAANNVGLPKASVLSKIVQYAIIIFAFLAALIQLGVSANWIITSISIIIGGIVLASAIAFGLGAKDMAAGFLKKFFE